jgi:hypothetical protein
MKLFVSIIFDIYLTTFKLAGYISKFFRQHKFIIKSYYSNRNRGENGSYKLSASPPPRYDKRQVSYPALRVSKIFVISK